MSKDWNSYIWLVWTVIILTSWLSFAISLWMAWITNSISGFVFSVSWLVITVICSVLPKVKTDGK